MRERLRPSTTLGAPVSLRLTGAALAVMAGVLVLRLPAIVAPLGIDQGIFSAAAWGMQHGLGLYTELWDQKPPGIHLIYRVAFTLLGPTPTAVFWLDLAAMLGTLLALAEVGRRCGGPRLACVVALLFAVLSTPSLRYSLGGFLERAVPETFIALLATLSAAIAVDGAARRGLGAPAAIGLTVGAAAVLKPTALVYLPVFLGWMAWRRARPFELGTWAVGTISALVVPGLTVAWLARHAALGDAWVAVVEYNRAYLAVGGGPLELVDRFAHDVWRRVKTDPLWMAGAVGGVALLWRCRRGDWRDPVLTLVPLWMGAALLAAAANGTRLYNSYFIPSLPPLALAAAWTIVEAVERPEAWRRAALGLVTAVVVVRSIAIGVPGRVFENTLADLAFIAGRTSETTYLERYGGYANGRGYSARANAELVEWLRERVEPGDRAFIFGMQPAVYVSARLMPANRFLWVGPTVAGLLPDRGFTLERLADDLARASPEWLILEANNRDSLLGWTAQDEFARPPMQALVAAYEHMANIEDFSIYRRRAHRERPRW